MRALVISGGGSKGAFAGGIAEFLIKECHRKYDIYIGSSTGSLLVPLLSIGKLKKLKRIYTTVTQQDIFSSNPFFIRIKDGEYRISINHFTIIRQFIRGARTFGESNNLKKLICEIITEADYDRMRKAKADVVVTVSNLSYNRVEYKCLKEHNYHEFCDWIWASANLIPFMSLFEREGMEYADGGMGTIVPIAEAIRRGARDLDIIVLKTEQPSHRRRRTKNVFELTTRVFDFMLDQIITDDILIGKLQGVNNKVTLNFYHPPEMLTKNSLVFDPVKMSKWWKEGLDYARKNSPTCKCIQVTS